MRNKSFLVIFLLITGTVQAGRITGVLSTSAYTFSRQNPEESSLLHLRLYQSFLLNGFDLGLKGSRLNISGVFYHDPVNSFGNEPVFQIYNFNYSNRWWLNRLALKLGRQFIYSTSVSGRMDGLTVAYKTPKLDLKVFGGGYVPASGLTDNPLNNHLLGVELGWKLNDDLGLRVGLSNKAHTRPVYRSRQTAKHIEVPATIQRRIGIQGKWQRDRLSLYIRSRHRISGFQMMELVFNTSLRGAKDNRLQSILFEYSFREPRVPENSIFSVFDTSPSQEYRLSGKIKLFPKIFSTYQVRHVLFNGDRSNILSLGLGTNIVFFEFIHQDGYGGSSDRGVANFRYPFRKFNLNSRLSFGSYRLIEGNWDDLATFSTGISYPVLRRFVLNAEIQVLRNKYYSNDTRLLLGLKYRI